LIFLLALDCILYENNGLTVIPKLLIFEIACHQHTS